MSKNRDLLVIRILLSLEIGLSSFFGILNDTSVYSIELLDILDYKVKIIVLSAILFCSLFVIILSFVSYNKLVWSILLLLWILVLVAIVFLDLVNIDFRNMDLSTAIFYIIAAINYIVYTYVVLSMAPKKKA